MKKKDQILIIHGGMTFKNKKDYLSFLKSRLVSTEKKISWSAEWLDRKLGKGYEIIRPRMPLQDDAKYEEWKIHFERFIPLLKNGVVLVGFSLGGIFLAKYLSEHKFPKKIKGVFLICPPFDNTVKGEDLVGGFKLKADISLLEKNTKNLYLLFSEDDDLVPVSHAEKYRRKLENAIVVIYKSKNGHFKITEFPEIVKIIKGLKKSK
ncbi:MAG: alpha/beta fold hydrolase [Parcubacteria group bacterium]